MEATASQSAKMEDLVIKVQYQTNLRRFIVPRPPASKFADVKARIREALSIADGVEFSLTYRDKDDDLVTMAGDDDLYDAFTIQNLNPLRVFVTVESDSRGTGPAPGDTGVWGSGWSRTAQVTRKSAPGTTDGSGWGDAPTAGANGWGGESSGARAGGASGWGGESSGARAGGASGWGGESSGARAGGPIGWGGESSGPRAGGASGWGGESSGQRAGGASGWAEPPFPRVGGKPGFMGWSMWGRGRGAGWGGGWGGGGGGGNRGWGGWGDRRGATGEWGAAGGSGAESGGWGDGWAEVHVLPKRGTNHPASPPPASAPTSAPPPPASPSPAPPAPQRAPPGSSQERGTSADPRGPQPPRHDCNLFDILRNLEDRLRAAASEPNTVPGLDATVAAVSQSANVAKMVVQQIEQLMRANPALRTIGQDASQEAVARAFESVMGVVSNLAEQLGGHRTAADCGVGDDDVRAGRGPAGDGGNVHSCPAQRNSTGRGAGNGDAEAAAAGPAANQSPSGQGQASSADARQQREQQQKSGLSSANDSGSSDSSNDCGIQLHPGIYCDGCGVGPIVGPRFKSLLRDDYDLCRKCKEEGVGREESDADYMRIDRPVRAAMHVRPSGRCGPWNASGGCHGPTGGPAVGSVSFGGRPWHTFRVGPCHGGPSPGSAKEYDARFVRDVTISDGMEIIPNTTFMKIWCMRNSGLSPWPPFSQLVFVGGDKLGVLDTVLLELPENGLPPGEEVDVAVECASPEQPGRYVSNWRLALPSGQKFGHRLWIQVQVVDRATDEGGEVKVEGMPSAPMVEELEFHADGTDKAEDMERALTGGDFSEQEVRSSMTAPTTAEAPGQGKQEQRPHVEADSVTMKVTGHGSGVSVQESVAGGSSPPLAAAVEKLAYLSLASEGSVGDEGGEMAAGGSSPPLSVAVEKMTYLSLAPGGSVGGEGGEMLNAEDDDDGAVDFGEMVHLSDEQHPEGEQPFLTADVSVSEVSVDDDLSMSGGEDEGLVQKVKEEDQMPTGFTSASSSSGYPDDYVEGQLGGEGFSIVEKPLSVEIEEVEGDDIIISPVQVVAREIVKVKEVEEEIVAVDEYEPKSANDKVAGHGGGGGKPEDAVRPPPKPDTNSAAAAAPVAAPVVTEADGFKLSLRQELVSMGFQNLALNDELLKQYQYDLARTVEDLVSLSSWEDKLEDLQSMGFEDVNLNRRLMLKHKGSVPNAVKELVQIAKTGSGPNAAPKMY
ncbi:hypothetical protein CBR_g19475 [Chara braunii]|uniref:ZZ-type domain-containing protein n=1 Tax=Chara braunii TaxID=69332 RepID=A0A388KYA9_CHABU|nr:hypothetical protein CBR_g19475 [Chara braunii]|eukprot:GBG74962.1 hypothetical protein CBR_g19475 [Chara braunii]